MRTTIFLCIIISLSLLWASPLSAQLQINGQLRTRSEFRDGQGAPLPESSKPAFFTSQRTRLSLLYSGVRIKTGITVQDVRVWGQEASTINRTTASDQNGLMLHEAWLEVLLNDSANGKDPLSLKLGRQELVYDDQRLIGNLDWLQQARRHDAALLKYENKSWSFHVGSAFNQNKEAASGMMYNNVPPGNYPGNTNSGSMYKSMEFLYAARKFTGGHASFLFFADQFNRYHRDSANMSVKIFDPGSNARFTTGFYVNQLLNKTGITSSAYYQFGHDEASRKVSAALLGLVFQHSFSKKFTAGPGIDYTTGGLTASTSHAFDPLYGTPHKFWGLMDYFYAASPFGNTGLTDVFIKSRWTPSQRLAFTGDVHHFSSATRVDDAAHPDDSKKYFGMEIDFTASLVLTKEISFEAGYAKFFASHLLVSPSVKNVPNADLNSNWAYVSVNIKPQFLNR